MAELIYLRKGLALQLKVCFNALHQLTESAAGEETENAVGA